MRKLALLLCLPAIAFAEEPLPDPASRCGEEDPDPTNRDPTQINFDVIARVQIACRPALQLFGAAGVRTLASTTAGLDAALGADGELTWNLPRGFQVRGDASATLGSGPLAVPGGVAEATIATPPGWFTTELAQRVVVERLPRMFTSRLRAPGAIDELVTSLRTSMVNAHYGNRGVIALPIAVERFDPSTPGALARVRWHVGHMALTYDSPRTERHSVLTVLHLRGERRGDVELRHAVFFDGRAVEGRSQVRAWAGIANVWPEHPASKLNFEHWSDGEGGFELRLPVIDPQLALGAGFGSFLGLASDGLVTRETRISSDASLVVGKQRFDLEGFTAWTATHDPIADPMRMSRRRTWTAGLRGSYGRPLLGGDLQAAVEVGRSFHVYPRGAMDPDAGFGATASLAFSASRGQRARPNRLPD